MRAALIMLSALYCMFGSSQSISELCPSQNTNGTIVSAEKFNDSLYATGFFTQICGESTNYFAKWENGSWIAKDIGLSDPGHSLRSIEDTLYIARYEESIDSNWLYRYDGSTLSTLGEGVYLTTASGFSQLPHLYDVVKYNGALVVCGEFDRVGSSNISGIMTWNGTQWEDMAGGLSGNIVNSASVIYPHEMMTFNGNLYVVGNFRYAGGIEVNGVAMWNGSQWYAMGSGFNGTVYGICVYNNEVYVGGSFTQTGPDAVNRIAKWDGTDWISPGFGFIEQNMNDFIFVHTIKEIDGELFIAGGIKNIEFPNLSTELCGGVITFNGTAVNTFNGGVPGNDIEAIVKDVSSDNLLIGGGVSGNGYAGIISSPANSTEFNLDVGLELYPNPAENNGVITIALFEQSDCSVIIKNALGQVVWAESFKQLKKTSFSLGLSPGIYYVKVQSSNIKKTQLLIVE